MSFSLSRMYALDPRTGSHDPLRPSEFCLWIRRYKKRTYVDVPTGLNLAYIAHRLYGDTEMWVILSELNTLIDPFKLPARIFIIPLPELNENLSRFDSNGRKTS